MCLSFGNLAVNFNGCSVPSCTYILYIEIKCLLSDGQTDRQTDNKTDRQTDTDGTAMLIFLH